MSVKDMKERKKYMGVWRWEPELTAWTMSRFPVTDQVQGQGEPEEEGLQVHVFQKSQKDEF